MEQKASLATAAAAAINAARPGEANSRVAGVEGGMVVVVVVAKIHADLARDSHVFFRGFFVAGICSGAIGQRRSASEPLRRTIQRHSA